MPNETIQGPGDVPEFILEIDDDGHVYERVLCSCGAIFQSKSEWNEHAIYNPKHRIELTG